MIGSSKTSCHRIAFLISIGATLAGLAGGAQAQLPPQPELVGWGRQILDCAWSHEPFVEVAARAIDTVARRGDGSVVAWGRTGSGECNLPAAQSAALPSPMFQPAPIQSAAGPAIVRAPLYADGSVPCTGADDFSHRAGTVVLRPVADGIAFHVVLTRAAPNWAYYVELSQGGTCQAPLRFHGLNTGAQGQGVFDGVYPAAAGANLILVDIVSEGGTVPSNPTLREIAPGHLLEVSVPAGGSTLLTLGFDAGPGPMPWLEQGFEFSNWGGTCSVPGQYLRESALHWGSLTSARLQHNEGRPFDLVSLDAYPGSWEDADYWVESDKGGYWYLNDGPNSFRGPEWEGVTWVVIRVGSYGDIGGNLVTDSYVVRVPALD